MRRRILVFAATATLLAAPTTFAAPTCQDMNGYTVKCGTQGAMPVGWTPSRQQLLERQSSRPKYPTTYELLQLIGVMGVFFALLALVPEFDGSRAGDWGEQEGDPPSGAPRKGKPTRRD